MKQEKELLLKDLCARLPYGIFVMNEGGDNIVYTEYYHPDIDKCKPYLRPMPSITREELYELQEILGPGIEIRDDLIDILDSSIHVLSLLELQVVFDWLYVHHFDIRNLIKLGLALEAPADMYTLNK